MAGREIGIIKWYDSTEGYGFIARKRGEDVYVHYSAINCDDGECDLREGMVVEFSVLHNNGDIQAQNVVVVD